MKNKNSFALKAGVVALFAFSLVSAQNYEQKVRSYINTRPEFKGANPELLAFKIVDAVPDESMKGTILNIRQEFNGIPVYNSMAVSLVKNDQITYFTENFQKNYKGTAATKSTISQDEAFNAALAALDLKKSSKYNTASKGSDNYVDGRLVYFPQDNSLVLAYELTFEEAGASNLWHVLVDANTSKVLHKENLTLSCNFHQDAYSSDFNAVAEAPAAKVEMSSPAKLLAPDNASYRVFALPLEAPTFGDRTLVSNPWDLTASPEGWHSTITNQYTITRGNNVYTYLDTDANNLPDDNGSPDGGANRVFDFPLDYNLTPGNYTAAAASNLFYMNNMMHDIFYKFGFNEANKNFQVNNFGKGGTGNDAVNAEARDGTGFDNANFSTPSDGSAPRMQMYLWNPTEVYRFTYNSPDDLKSRKPLTQISNTFGAAVPAAGVTGDLVASTPTDGCTAFPAGAFTDKIAFIARGTCAFTIKVKNAQDAGAKAAVIYNVDATQAFGGMGGTDATITIPAVLIKKDEGDIITAKIAAGTPVNITLKDDKSTYIYRDGSLDNGIIAHEYGHGISTRLTGTSVSCLSSTYDNEQMGEGWSDFFALNVTNQPNATAAVPRGVGTFAAYQNPTDLGIRPAKYSPDFAINNYTYGKTNGMYYTNASNQVVPDVHSIGFVWNTMLWDLYWKYAEKYGYNRDLTADMTSGPARFMQTVMNGLKLQGCFPTFIKGRDAIIAADQALTSGENKCMIWTAFAKRGLGANAKPGAISGAPATALTDQVEDFTIPADACQSLAVTEAAASKSSVSVYPNPAKNEFFLKSEKQIAGKLNVEVYDASGKLVAEQKISASESVNTQALTNGVYVVKVKGLGVDYSSKLMIKK